MNRQQKHARAKLILKIAGPIVAAAGLTLTIICFADLFSSVADGKGLPDLFWFGFIGLPLLGIGIALTMFGYRKELARYIKNETVPVINEAAAEIAPAAKITAAAASEGFSADDIPCPACEEKNRKDAKFCKSCGNALQKACSSCGATIDAESKFCDHCGKQI